MAYADNLLTGMTKQEAVEALLPQLADEMVNNGLSRNDIQRLLKLVRKQDRSAAIRKGIAIAGLVPVVLITVGTFPAILGVSLFTHDARAGDLLLTLIFSILFGFTMFGFIFFVAMFCELPEDLMGPKLR